MKWCTDDWECVHPHFGCIYQYYDYFLPPSVAALAPPTLTAAVPYLELARALVERPNAGLLRGPGAQVARTQRRELPVSCMPL